MITTFTLDAEFANSDGSSQHLRLKNFDPTKIAEEIKASLTKLTQLNLFEKTASVYLKRSCMRPLLKKESKPFSTNEWRRKQKIHQRD